MAETRKWLRRAGNSSDSWAKDISHRPARRRLTFLNRHESPVNDLSGRAGRGGADRLGRLGRWLDPVAGKLVTIWSFVMVLACLFTRGFS